MNCRASSSLSGYQRGREVDVPGHHCRRTFHSAFLSHGKTMTPIISVRDLMVEYDGRRVLNGLNLDIEHGETMVFLGGSGCGKSTLLRQIIGLEKPKSGSVFVKEVDIVRCSKPELKKIRRSIGVAFQSAALFNSLNIEENVALPLRGWSSRGRRAHREQGRYLDCGCGSFSSGRMVERGDRPRRPRSYSRRSHRSRISRHIRNWRYGCPPTGWKGTAWRRPSGDSTRPIRRPAHRSKLAW
jgi:ABC-type glutathione transport system ATPase component